jgi:hypothetical protein
LCSGFYYYDEEDARICTRIKPDIPSFINDRSAKYLSPKDTKNRFDFPPVHKKIAHNIWAVIKDPKAPLHITEGEKKCLKANLEGIPCIGLAGVWSWKTRDLEQTSVPLPSTAFIKKRGEQLRQELLEKYRIKDYFHTMTYEDKRKLFTWLFPNGLDEH